MATGYTITLNGTCRMPGTISLSSMAMPNASACMKINSGAVMIIPSGVALSVGQLQCLGAKGTGNGVGIVATEAAGMGSLTIAANISTLTLGAVRVERIAAGTIASGTLTTNGGASYTLGLGAAAGTGTEGGTGVAVGLATQLPAGAPISS